MLLFIAEKPALAKAIAAAMPGPHKFDESAGVYRKEFEGEEAVIFACRGHLLTLAKPEEYDEKYRQWKMEDLPIFFKDWKKSIPDDADKKKRVEQLVKLCKQADTVVIAGDMDDEGQLLCDELVEWAGFKGKQLRLNTLDTAPAAMFRALHHMDDNAKHIQDGLSAAGREVSDMVFGFNLTRYYTIINQARQPLSVGRVQTPTLGLVVRRDQLINSHQKVFYYTVEASLDVDSKKVNAKYVPKKDDSRLEDGRILDKSYAEQIAASIRDKTFPNTVIEKKTVKESPPLPFNFAKLTTYCGSKWDYSPDKVMAITQKLRDNYNAITYNRSDCQYLTEEYFKQAPKTVPTIASNIKLDASLFDTSIHSKCFNDEEVAKGSHFAIIPTDVQQDLSKFTAEEHNVYQAIARYYLAQFMPPATKEKTRLSISLPDGGTIEAVSTVIIDPGYRKLIHPESEIQTGEDDEDKPNEDASSSLSDIKPGTYTSTCKSADVTGRETKPPSHYTEATLMDDMTRISKYCENETIKQLLLQKDKGKKDENGSIGTTATRPAIIKTLKDRGYISEFKKGKLTYIQATELGIEFYNSLPDSIRKVDVTAKWYLIQEDIRAGKRTPEYMAEDVLKSVTKIIESGEGRMANAEKLGAGLMGDPIGVCPKCGKNMFMSAKNYRCEGCGFTVWYNNKLLEAIGKSPLRPNVMTSLLKTGKATLKGCVSKKTGKKFDTILRADFSGERMELSLDNGPVNENSLGKCPKCGTGDIAEFPSNFKCNNPECGFAMYKDDKFLKSMKKTLTASIVKEVLATRKAKLTGCKSAKTGKTYSCTLIMKEELSQGKYVQWDREFEPR